MEREHLTSSPSSVLDSTMYVLAWNQETLSQHTPAMKDRFVQLGVSLEKEMLDGKLVLVEERWKVPMSDVEPVKREADCPHSQWGNSLTLHGRDEIYVLEEVS